MEQLIEIWQSVQTDQSKTDKKYKPEDLFPQVIKLEKNQKNVLLFKTLSSISILFLLIMVFITQFTLALNGIIGIGIITISILGSVILLNRLRFRISDEERSLSTNSLVQVVETKIKNEEKIFTVYLPVVLLFIILGINLMYFEFLSDMEIKVRIFYHMILSVSMVVAFFLGLSVRIKRFKKRFLPLLNRIKKFKSAANSNSGYSGLSPTDLI